MASVECPNCGTETELIESDRTDKVTQFTNECEACGAALTLIMTEKEDDC